MRISCKRWLRIFSIIWMSAGFLLLFCASCASTSEITAAPGWVLDQRSVFPSGRYISASGESPTKDGSRTEASANIAQYFKTEISTQSYVTSSAVSDGNATTMRQTFDTETQVSSSISLFGLEYTEPFYLKKQKSWCCVAYIDREKAWAQYKPGVEKSKAEFYAMYQNGETESDPFSKIVMYKKSLKA